jgi:hypothetical protein
MANSLRYDAGMFLKIKRAAARSVLYAAKLLQTEQMVRTGVINPPPYLNSSQAGEYPRKRSGVGQAACVLYPETISAIMEQGYCWVGYVMPAFNYMDFLVNHRDRLGLVQTMNDLKTRMGLIALSNFKEEGT